MKLFGWFFKAIEAKKPEPIKIGVTYIFSRGREHPFNIPDNTRHEVIVKDVKEGWVLYDFLPHGGLFQNQTLKEDSFRYCYKEKK